MINVIFLQDKHNINAVFCAKRGKGSVYLTFIPVFKPHIHKLYILRQCANIVYISIELNQGCKMNICLT